MHIRLAKLCFITMLLSLLFACGGGGGSTPTPPAPPVDQTIAFATPNAASGGVGTIVNNAASGGAGTGAITYVSSNTSVATVNASTGAANLLSVGTSTITATKAASSGFNQATASYVLTVTQGTQTISFVQGGPLQVLIGGQITNTAAGGAGTGAIEYGSSNDAVASVNVSTGVVSANAAGVATITAYKNSDTNYQAAQTTYIVAVSDTASLGAWIGATDTQVTLPAAANGMNFVRARGNFCNLAAVSSCTSGQSTLVAGAPTSTIVDSAVSLSNAGSYWLQSGTFASRRLPISATRFSERLGHTVAYFNNRYYVIGGAFGTSTYSKADVWSSADGRVWELDTANAPFGRIFLHQTVVFQNLLWVFGGVTTTGTPSANNIWALNGPTWVPIVGTLPGGASPLNFRVTVFNNAMWAVIGGSAYSSTDGANWTLRSSNVGTPGVMRAYATLNSFAGKLWYIGGAPNFGSGPNLGTATNDVWNSADGITWTQVLPSGPTFSPRMQHVTFALNNRLWVYGGRNAVNGVITNRSDSAWSTTDGVTWRQEALSNTVGQSYFGSVVEQSDRVTLIGGINRGYVNRVLQTTDGNTWNDLSANAQFSARILMSPTSFLGDLWVIGGSTLTDVAVNDIWRSSDGLNWRRVTPSGPIFSPRSAHRTLVYNGRLWVIGGWDNTIDTGGLEARLNDVWSTADGVTWRQETANAAFSPREAMGAAVFNGRMYIVGGETATATAASDVWWSTDGIAWNLATSSTAFGGRHNHGLVVHNNALWLTAGSNGMTMMSDVWTSTDGSTWTLVPTSGSVFAARGWHNMLTYNNRMWVIGGASGGPYPTPASPASPNFGDVWSSADGVSWQQVTANAPFGPRWLHGGVVHNSQLWVIGGQDLGRDNQVWSSTDGVSWRVGVSDTIRMSP